MSARQTTRWIASAAATAMLMAALPSAAQAPAAPGAAPAPARGAGRGAGAAAAPAAPFAAEIEAFRAEDRATPPDACEVLLVGSSSIRMWKTAQADLAPMKVINRGFGGSTIADVDYYFRDVVAPYRPREILFYAGDNDVSARKSTDQIMADFTKFMTLKTQALGDTPVYVVSVKPSKARIDQIAAQAEVNVQLKAMAAKRKDLVYIDVVPAMMLDGKPRDIFIADGLHMTAEGYAIWTRIVKPVLAAPPPTRAPGC